MNLNVGDIIEIRGKEATVCYTTEHNEKKYICVSFEKNGKISFELFEYKFEDNKLLVTDELDNLEKIAIMKIFIQEGLSEYELPEELQKKINIIADKFDK